MLRRFVKKPRSPLFPMFLIVLVDVFGFTIVIPLLPLYAETFDATPLIATTLVSVYALCSLISTPIIGKLSDHYGRRPLLMFSQIGTMAGFIMLGFSSSLWMVFAGRILDGITAGNLSIAQAYISDHTKPENRAKAFGVIGVAFGVGFMIGPGLGGWLGHAYGLHVPFVVAASLSGLSALCTYTLLPKEEPPRESGEIVAPAGKRPGAFDLDTYREYFRRPGLGVIYLQFFLFSFAFSAFFSGSFALFAERRFTTAEGKPWGASEVGLLFTYTGLLGIILQGGMLGRLVKRFGELKLTIAGFATAMVSYIMIGAAFALPLLMVGATIAAFGNGVLRPVITSRLTQAVGRHEQGIALGISGSLSSLAMMFAPPSGGAMLDRGWLYGWAAIPTTFVALGLLVALIASGARRSTGAAPPAELESPP
jgi:MFS transporter, DHA1 family, tetracycline resistance protein